jgi:putative membrane protein
MPKTTDHLANERTFLAWIRTSISLMGFGVVIARLRFIAYESAGTASRHPGRSIILGLLFAIVGLVCLLYASINYNRNRRMIEEETFSPLDSALIPFVVILFLLGLATVAYLLTLAS